jgi:DNA-binding transcriptional ArsR family regulator
MYVEHDRTHRFDLHQTSFSETRVTRRRDGMAEKVGSLHQVLAALADPVRLEMVRRLAGSGEPIACGQLYDGVNKSTASHHFKILREAGLIERVVLGGQTCQVLRSREVEEALPGVLASVVAAATA